MFAMVLATVLDFIPTIFNWMIALGLFVLAPMTIFHRTRRFAALGFMIEAPIFALLLWISSAFQVYAYWGLATLIVSLFGFWIPGTVIACVIATVMHGTGTELFGLMIMIVATISSIFAAFMLNRSVSRSK